MESNEELKNIDILTELARIVNNAGITITYLPDVKYRATNEPPHDGFRSIIDGKECFQSLKIFMELILRFMINNSVKINLVNSHGLFVSIGTHPYDLYIVNRNDFIDILKELPEDIQCYLLLNGAEF